MTCPDLGAALARLVSDRVGSAATITDLARISSVGNAREPWSFTASWDAEEVRCVMLVKAAAGQLETALRPEYETIAALWGSGVPVPRALWLDDTGEALGRQLFVTEWVPGSADTRSLRSTEGDDDVRSVALELARAAATLHRLDVASFPHLTSTPETTPSTAASLQLDYWDALLRRQRLEPHPVLVYGVRWLRQRIRPAHRVSLVHGDLRFGNLLAAHGRLTALLDWEMTHLGDPIEDLGWVYRSLWSPAASLPFPEFLAAYVDAGGGPVDRDQLRWWQVFSEVKHAVISLTGTRSFADGATTALRHANRAATVPAFDRRLLQLIGEQEKEG
jgi:aminoglycoside phosphotransferase (APT) family kinase protein